MGKSAERASQPVTKKVLPRGGHFSGFCDLGV